MPNLEANETKISFGNLIRQILIVIIIMLGSFIVVCGGLMIPFGTTNNSLPTLTNTGENIANILLIGIFVLSAWRYLGKYFHAILNGGCLIFTYIKKKNNQDTHLYDSRDAKIFLICFYSVYFYTLLFITDRLSQSSRYISISEQTFYTKFVLPWTLAFLWIASIITLIWTVYLVLIQKKYSSIDKKSVDTIINEPTIIDDKQLQALEISTTNSESTDLMNSLSQVDIVSISGITFLPKVGKGFQVQTPNIKRLAIYITTKLGKTTFEVEELRIVYNHVVENLQSNLSKTDFNTVQGRINEFVQSGGEIKIDRL